MFRRSASRSRITNVTFESSQVRRASYWALGLPAAGLHEVLFFDGCGGETFHRTDDGFAGFGDDLWVVEVGGGDDDGAGAADGLFALLRIVLDIERGGALLHEDARAYENCFG